jgi:RPA family protein
MEIRRQTAMRVRISDLVNSKFVHKEGLEPSYILTDLGQRIFRVKLVGTVVDKFMSEDGNYSSITLNDDTNSIRIKAFKDDVNVFNNIELGDHALIIGKAKEYAEENYIIPEIVRKIQDPNYETLHKLEVLKTVLTQKKVLDIINKEKGKFSDLDELKKYLSKEYNIEDHISEGIIETFMQADQIKEKDYKPLILETIGKLDKGEGIEILKLIKESKVPENIFNEVITELLTDGVCYEPSPGVIKIV